MTTIPAQSLTINDVTVKHAHMLKLQSICINIHAHNTTHSFTYKQFDRLNSDGIECANVPQIYLVFTRVWHKS